MNREDKIAQRVMMAVSPYTFARDFMIPKSVKVTQIDDEGTGADIKTWEFEGRLMGVAYFGKASKPLWYYRFTNESSRRARIKDTIENLKSRIKFKQDRLDERRNFQHTLKVGDILTGSWGYDQTNIDYYVVKEVGQKSVKIREIGSKVVGHGSGTDRVVANPNAETGPVMLKRVGPRNGVKISSYLWVYPWDGRPQSETDAMSGH